MPKYYFDRDKEGRPRLYHWAPGGDEIHVPAGDKKEDFVHLIPIEPQMPQIDRHPFWSSFLGKFFGGDSGTAAFRFVQLILLLWGAFKLYDGLIEKYGPLPQQVHEIKVSQDSLAKAVGAAIGDAKQEGMYRTQSNITYRIVNKHFPTDVARAREEQTWNTGRDNGN